MTGYPAHKRVLIAMISPESGGVHTMAGHIATLLEKRGFQPVIAHYEPYSSKPDLSVPSFKLLQRSVTAQTHRAYGHLEAHAIGAWLPELEFTHYLATSHWRRLMDGCDAFVMVSGNILAATAFWQTKRPYLAWVATDWAGDRKDRVSHFSWPRKILDCLINGPIIRYLEKRLIQSGRILALSDYTARMLSAIARTGTPPTVLPMPVDTGLFTVQNESTQPGHIGFTGRFDDPRKNIPLLLDAVALLKKKRLPVTVSLIGGKPSAELIERVARSGLGDQVKLLPKITKDELIKRLQTFDVFVLPSHQEGLCISALEAMACGVPVVSTRCGGPEEFVIDNQTGFLVDFDAQHLAQAIEQIISNRPLRATLSTGARHLVEQRYAPGHAERIFFTLFFQTFPALQQG